MAKAPTTYDDLRNAVSTEREALVLAAVLPNIYENECVIDIRGYTDVAGNTWYETDESVLEEFRRRETPIVPGSDLYRVHMVSYDDVGEDEPSYKGALPIPHGFKCYDIDRTDVVEFVRVDPEDADYEPPYHTLADYGCGNPYYNAYYANRDAFDREPHLPV